MKILRKATAAAEAVVPQKKRYRLVAELKAEGVRAGYSCHARQVSRSGFYNWAGRVVQTGTPVEDTCSGAHSAEHPVAGAARGPHPEQFCYAASDRLGTIRRAATPMTSARNGLTIPASSRTDDRAWSLGGTGG